jgi:hypothetical protein
MYRKSINPRTITLRKPGYEDYTYSLYGDARHVGLTISLKPADMRYRVNFHVYKHDPVHGTMKPLKADITITGNGLNEKLTNFSSGGIDGFAPGTYRYTYSAKGYQSGRGEFQVKGNWNVYIALKPPPKKTISITPMDARTKSLIYGATVILNGPSGKLTRKTTQKDFVATFYNVPVGRYTYTVTAKNYQDLTESLDLTASKNENLVKYLQPGGAKLRVGLINENGPVTNARLIAQGAGRPTVEAITNSQGIAEFSLSNGQYHITPMVSAQVNPGTRTVNLAHAGIYDIKLEMQPQSRPKKPAQIGTYVPPNTKFQVRVIDKTGEPVNRANVVATYRKRTAFGSYSRKATAVTNSAGYVYFGFTPGRARTISVNATGHNPATWYRYKGVNVPEVLTMRLN